MFIGTFQYVLPFHHETQGVQAGTFSWDARGAESFVAADIMAIIEPKQSKGYKVIQVGWSDSD